MCLLTTESKERITETDIFCYKVLRILDDGRFVTPVKGKKVSSKVLCGKRLFKPSFFSLKKIKKLGWSKEITKGYIHCYASKPHFTYTGEKCFICVIPKGTRYWYDEIYGEYAARKIRFVEEMNKEMYKEMYTGIVSKTPIEHRRKALNLKEF